MTSQYTVCNVLYLHSLGTEQSDTSGLCKPLSVSVHVHLFACADFPVAYPVQCVAEIRVTYSEMTLPSLLFLPTFLPAPACFFLYCTYIFQFLDHSSAPATLTHCICVHMDGIA